MHSKYQRRHLHAERAPTVQRRQSGNTAPSNSVGSVDSSTHVVVDGFTLTGPITLTFLTTVQSTTTPSSSSTISTTSTVQSTSSSPTISPTTSAVDSSSQTPSTSSPSTLFPSIILPTTTPSGTSSGNSTAPQQVAESSALSTTQLSGGNIAGITIGCLIVLAAGLFYLIRSRSRRGRMKLRDMWTRNSPLGISSSSYEPKSYGSDSVPPNMSPVMKFAPDAQIQRQKPFERSSFGVTTPASSTMPLPPPTYNNDFEATSPRSPQSPPRSPSGGFNAPVYTPGGATPSMSPFSATVVCTFITSLPDELSIKVGETIRILADYDDGWALCMNVNGEQGMVPLECLSRGRSTQPDISGAGGLAPPMPDRDARGSRRVSSLNASAPALKAYRF